MLTLLRHQLVSQSGEEIAVSNGTTVCEILKISVSQVLTGLSSLHVGQEVASQRATIRQAPITKATIVVGIRKAIMEADDEALSIRATTQGYMEATLPAANSRV